MIVSVYEIQQKKKKRYRGHRTTNERKYGIVVKRENVAKTFCLTFYLRENETFGFRVTRLSEGEENGCVHIFDDTYHINRMREFFEEFADRFKNDKFDEKYIRYYHEIYDYIMAHLNMLIYNPYVINWGV